PQSSHRDLASKADIERVFTPSLPADATVGDVRIAATHMRDANPPGHRQSRVRNVGRLDAADRDEPGGLNHASCRPNANPKRLRQGRVVSLLFIRAVHPALTASVRNIAALTRRVAWGLALGRGLHLAIVAP